MNKQIISEAAKHLAKNRKNAKILLGFDGFIDEIIHVVKKRTSPTYFERIEMMKDFAKGIENAAGLSANFEFANITTKLGGNGTIMANALIRMGHPMTYIGSLGKDSIHPLFSDFAEACQQVISYAEPGHTDAVEFYDGKLMFGKTIQLNDLDWENLLAKVSIKELREILSDVDFIGFTNWTMINSMNSIIIGFDKILQGFEKRKTIFFDLADPKKRPGSEIEGVIDLMKKLQIHSDVIFGMNQNESRQIAEILGFEIEDITQRTKAIQDATGLTAIVVHPVKGAAVATAEFSAWVDGPYTPKPKLTTGAGDNFNAGFSHGWLSGLTPEQCLVCGVFTSGYYVRNAKSPSHQQLINFMNEYK